MHASSHTQPQHEAVLTNSQQLRNEFTFLLRALDHCGTVHREQQHTDHHHLLALSHRRQFGASQAQTTGSSAGSSAVFTYVLEVALALVRFDVLLSSEERRLLVHAFDRLLDEELRSLHRTQQELIQLDELTNFLNEALRRASALDIVDWHHVTARYVVEREQWLRNHNQVQQHATPSSPPPQTQVSSDETPLSTTSTNVATPKASSSGGLFLLNTECSRNVAQAVVSPSALYTNLLLYGTCHKASTVPSERSSEGDVLSPLTASAVDHAPQQVHSPQCGPRECVLAQTDAFTIMQTSNLRHNNSYLSLRASSSVLTETTAATTTTEGTATTSPAPHAGEPPIAAPIAFVLYQRPLVIPERTAQWSTHLLVPPPQSKRLNGETHLVVSMRPSSMGDVDDSTNTCLSTVTLLPRKLSSSVFGAGAAATVSTPKSKDGAPFSTNDEEIASLASTTNEGNATVHPLSAPVSGSDLGNRDGVNATTPVPSTVELHGEPVRRTISSISRSSALSRTGSGHNIDVLPGAAPQRKPTGTSTTTVKGASTNALSHTSSAGSGPAMTPNRGTEPTGNKQRAAVKPSSTFPPESPDPAYQLLHRIVSVALSDGDDKALRGYCGNDLGSTKVGVSPAPPSFSFTTNASPLDSATSFTASLLVPDVAALQRPVSGPIVKTLERMLASVGHVRRSLHAMKRQIRSEITLLCFRVVSTVIDLLLPAAECRGKPLTIFYRKWLCDVYRVLCEESLLKPFASLVNRARQTPETNVVAMPTPPKPTSAVRRTLSPSLAPLDLGDSIRATTSPIMPMPSDANASMNGLLNASMDGLDESTTLGPADAPLTAGGTSLQPHLLHRHLNDGCGNEDVDEDDANTAVGALFRTYRLDNGAGEQLVMSPSSVGSCGSSSNAGGVVGKQHTSEAVSAARTLFRSLHGVASIPPAGHLGTRLMFTLLNGTDVNALDLKETELTQSVVSSDGVPISVDAFGSATHHARSNSLQDQLSSTATATRSRTNSQMTPLMSPSIHKANAARSPGLGHASTTTMLAMPHHHTFRYPVVRDAGDVRGLYSALFSDAEAMLMPHDPLRAAVTLNYAEFLVRVVGAKAEAAETIRSYLDDVEMEPIQQVVNKAVDFGTAALNSGPSLSTHTAPPPASSAFSVTSVRRTGAAGGAGTTNQPPSTPLAAHSTSVAAAPNSSTTNSVSIMDFVPSWQTKEERTQFFEIVGLLRAAEASLR